jgi:predicted RND superfamily exporter protein
MIFHGEKKLRRAAIFSCRHYRIVLWGTLILGLLSGWLVSRLQLQTDVLNLLPAHAPATGSFVRFLKEFGAGDSLFIVLERKSGGEVESFAPFAGILAERLMATGELKEIQGRLDPGLRESIARQFSAKALLYLNAQDLREMETRLTDGAIQQRVHDLKAKLHSPLSSFTSRWIAQDPFDLWPLFLKYLPTGSLDPPDSHGVLLSEDRKMILLVAKPKGSAPDIRYDEKLLDKIQDAERTAREIFAREKKINPATYFQDLRVGFAGGYITALEDSRTIKKELILNFTVSLAGVLFLFIFAFRSGMALFYAIIPLLASPLLTLGLFSFLLGRVSEAVGAFSAIILGLSIDFIILLYNRYLEEKNAGQGLQEAMETSLSRTGPGVLTGAVTTAVAYYALFVSDFRGVQELGFLTGSGILISLACAFFLLPALVAWGEKGKRPGKQFRPASSFFHLERLTRISLNHPAWVLGFCAVIFLATAVWAFQVRLNNDPRSLRPAAYSSLILEERIQEKMGEGQETIVVLAENENPDQSLEVQGMLKAKFESAMARGVPISRFENLTSFIPPLSRQQPNLEWLKARENGPLDPGRIENTFQAALQQEGLRAEPFEAGLKMLQEMLANREILAWKHFEASPLRGIGERFIKKLGRTFTSVAYLHVRPGVVDDPQLQTFLRSLQGPDIQVTGSKLVQKEMETLMIREAWLVILIALAGVCLLIYLDFRSFRLTAISLLPVILASFWTLGFMGFFKMDLNFMNLVVFTMVLGVGVDYGVHILHRGLESKWGQLEPELDQVGRGVVYAALTTLVGFGSLVLSGYPGLRSMGAVALMGVGFSFLVSLTLVPVLLQKLLPKRPSS